MTAPTRALSFFDEARAAFGGKRVEHYRIAGRYVRVAMSDGFDFVDRAFGHLRTQEASAPDLEIFVWDKQMPSPPWTTDDYGAQGEIRGFNDARFRTAFDYIGSSLSMLDAERNLAIFWMRDANALPQADHGAPLKTILHWWLQHRDDLFVHGGAIGNETGAALLAGAGGAGKSTTALLCAAAGMNYLGDDYCAVVLNESPSVYGLYGTGKVARGEAHRFEEFSLTSSSTEDKALFYMKTTERLPLRAILLPRVDPSATETKIKTTTAAEGLKALAPSTISQLTGAGAATFQRLAQLARQVPCFELSLARDFDRIPEVIRAFFDEL